MAWNTHNKLLCNPDKTEGIQFSFRFVRHPIIRDFLLGDTIVHLWDRVCNCGVIVDKELNLSYHHHFKSVATVLSWKYHLSNRISKSTLYLIEVQFFGIICQLIVV